VPTVCGDGASRDGPRRVVTSLVVDEEPLEKQQQLSIVVAGHGTSRADDRDCAEPSCSSCT